MAIDKDTIQSLLEELEQYIFDIETMSFTTNDVIGSRDLQHLLNHRLHTAVEICIDIASHISAALRLPREENAADIFEVLARHGIIDKNLKPGMVDAVRERNILIHEYGKVDYELVVGNLEDDLNDLRNFAAQIHLFLEKQED